MRTLVLGGIRSGKSAWAESELAGNATVRYLATGPLADPAGSTRPDSGTWARRVAEHRRRRPAHWTTVETTDVAAELRGDRGAPTMVDDLGGWLTGLLDRLGWESDRSVDAASAELADAVGNFGGPLLLVSPEVGLSVVPATAAGCRFADALGLLNQRLAAVCDRVVLVIAGQPLWVKQ